MTKHPLDRPREAAGARTGRYVDLEKAGKPHPASQTLQKRNRGTEDARMANFTRIERNREE